MKNKKTNHLRETIALIRDELPEARVLLSTSHLTDPTLERTIRISEFDRIMDSCLCLGFHGLELGTIHLEEEFQGSAPLETLEKLSVFQGREIGLALHNAFPLPSRDFIMNLLDRDQANRDHSLRVAVQGLKLSRAIGASAFGVHPGFLGSPASFPDRHGFRFIEEEFTSEHRTEAMERLLDSLDQVMAATGTSNSGSALFCIENPPLTRAKANHLMLGDPDELLFLAQQAESRGAALLLDLGHLRVTAATLGLDPVGMMESLAPFTGALHISQNDGSADQHLPPVPDSWFMGRLKCFRERCRQVTLEAAIEMPWFKRNTSPRRSRLSAEL